LQTASGNYSSYAVKTDGTLWAWGDGGNGQLGQGNTTTYSSPVQVGALTTWSTVGGGRNHALAIKTDGTLWVWGSNGYGQLGQGNTTDYSSPVQVGALTTWDVLSKSSLGNASMALLI
jgi:alpha-tubulin suppressor-like RCC1 family protein